MQVPAGLDWVSPLKVTNSVTAPKKSSRTPKKLFSDQALPQTRTLSELYAFNLDQPPLRDKDRHFFAVRDLVQEIENILKHQPNNQTTSLWRTRVSKQLLEPNFDKKMAELGSILFYISKDEYNLELLEITHSLMQYRAQELHLEVAKYLACSSESILPSGKTHYLMRAFAHMAVTKDHVYNQGGLIAVRELITNPQYHLAGHLTHEHIDHIVAVIDQLLAKPSTPKLFNTPVTIHKSLQDLIRIDLKLDSDSPIDSVLILYDCLIALFSDVRQLNYPNCYAIASFIYATENHTNTIAYKMLEWLRTGYYMFENRLSIPIRPLLEGHLTSSTDLSLAINPTTFLTLPPIEHIQNTLGLKTSGNKDSTALSLDQALQTLLPDGAKEEQKSYVTKLYNGFKYNALVAMNIALLEFENSNLAGKHQAKEELILCCILAVKKASPTELSDKKLNVLGELLEKKLWLQPCYEKKVVNQDGSVTVGSGKSIRLAANENSILNLLDSSVRLFFLNKDQFQPLYSISDLYSMLRAAMSILGIPGTLDQKYFSEEISKVCKQHIRHFEITADMLKRHNLLVFGQNGGNGDLMLDRVYQISGEKREIPDVWTAHTLVGKLFGFFKNFRRKNSQEAPKLLIYSTNSSANHQWTVATKYWKVFSTHANFRTFSKENIFNSANRRLNSQPPKDLFSRILLQYTDDVKVKANLIAIYKTLNNPTYRDLLLLLRREIPSRDKEKIRTIVDDEFSKVSVDKKLLSRILLALNIKVTTSIFNNIFNAIDKVARSPFLLARDIRLALITHKTAVADPYQIEIAICNAKGLPIPIHIGDSNWTDEHREDPSHTTFWSRFSYWDDTLSYYIQADATATRTQNRDYRDIVVLHPET